LPDDAIIVEWANRMVAASGKPPLVIVDSLIVFSPEMKTRIPQ
jgi:hypothetical protein